MLRLLVLLLLNVCAAGGGSRLLFRDGLFVVGPESVGAQPGPVCYRKVRAPQPDMCCGKCAYLWPHLVFDRV